MERTLIDANVLIAAVNPLESKHQRAREIIAREENLIATELVTNETVNVIARRLGKESACRVFAGMITGGTKITYLDDKTLITSYKIFQTIKPLSFADAANIAVMRSLGITRIATFDEAFKKIPGIEVIC